MLSSVSTLLLCLVICRSVVYQNGIGVMNIQFAEEYKMWRRGKRSVGFWAVGAGARERKNTWSRGWREGVGAGGPNSEDEVGAGGPNSEEGVGAGAREKKDAGRNMSMKRRRD